MSNLNTTNNTVPHFRPLTKVDLWFVSQAAKHGTSPEHFRSVLIEKAAQYLKQDSLYITPEGARNLFEQGKIKFV